MRTNVQRLIRIVIAGVFLLAAWGKFRAGRNEGTPVTIYDGWSQKAQVRYAIMACEAATGIWLLWGRWSRTSAAVVVVLLSVFSGLIVAEFGRDHPRPCGCFGDAFVAAHDPVAIRVSLQLDLMRNALLITGATWLYRTTAGR
jgi:uncharacterized membrane protein YphA (DoxX/SURF4 family)